MSGAKSPAQANSEAWAKHEAAERDADYQMTFVTIGKEDVRRRQILLSARRRAAERFPGCVSAILSDDPDKNWDRGSIIRELVDHTPV